MIYLSSCILFWFVNYQLQNLICDGKKALFSLLLFLSQIGSSPGFEDGEFQYAKLMRPAASFYHTSEDCLYFVDSEVLSRSSLNLQYVSFEFSSFCIRHICVCPTVNAT